MFTIVYFEDGNSVHIASALEQARKSTPKLETNLIIEQKNFSRGGGLRKALLHINATNGDTDGVVWLCDVDMAFTEDFVDRCQSTPVRNQQASCHLNTNKINKYKLHYKTRMIFIV